MLGKLRFILSLVPAAIVLALIGAAAWWGHTHDWKLPKNGEAAEKDDWCAEHSVPESICVECNPSLMPKPKPRGWSKAYGLPECVLEHPDLAQLSSPAEVSTEELARAKRMLDFAPRSENNPICKLHERRIQFATSRDADKAGVEVQPVGYAPAIEFVAAPGEIGYDQTRIAHLSTRSAGTVWRVFKHLGDRVQTGEVLALIDAAEVGRLKSELLQSFGALALRTQTLASLRDSGSVVSDVKLREAEAAVQESQIRLDAARQMLVNLGLPLAAAEIQNISAEQLKAKLQYLAIPPEVAKALDGRTSTTNLLPVVSPMNGLIVSRDVVAGEVMDSNRVLFEVVDNRNLWLTCDVTSENARRLKIGQPVRFKPDDSRDEISGTLAWVSTQADPKTRTVKVRANLEDPEGRLRANTFGSGRIILRDEPKVIAVPDDAVQWEGDCHIVFVRDKDYLKKDGYKVFHVRKVRVGAKNDGMTEVIGVLPGEVVAVKGSGAMLAELLRGNFGEGCGCGH